MKEMACVMFPGEWRVLLFVYAAVLLRMGWFGCLIESLTILVLLPDPSFNNDQCRDSQIPDHRTYDW